MAGVDLTSVDHALKTLYPEGPHIEVIKESPVLAMLGKDTDFVGRNRVIDIIYAGNRARSAKFAKAKANGSSSKGTYFTITRAKNYAYGTITRETLLAAKKDKGALIDALATESRTMMETFRQDLGGDAYGNGSGKRARIGAISSDVITLTDPLDSIHFEVGDILELSATETGGSVKTGTLTVEAVDRDAGTLTCTTPVTTGVATAAVNDYIYHEGDYDDKAVGFGGWLPTAAPSGSDDFFGVNRSVDPTKLAGVRFNGSSLNHEEALVKGLMAGVPHSAFPKDVFMNSEDVGALELLLGSKKNYEDVEAAGIGFTALTINGPKGKVRIFTDPWAPKGYALGLTLEHWKMHSLTEVPHWVLEDGNKLDRQSDADGFEFRLAGYYQFACEAPGKNIRISLPSI